MPRLIPRLLKAIARGEHERGGYSGPLVTLKRPRVPSLWRPTKSTYNFRPGQQSLLLEPENPIIERRLYERHKKLPPYLRPKGRRNVVETEVDTPREMNEQERTWWASPYLRMLSSPMRKCFYTDRHLPSDFLVRLTRLHIPGAKRGETIGLFPDGLQHPRFKSRIINSGKYILCWKAAVESMIDNKGFKKAMSIAHALLPEQISQLLRLRVVQELEMLASRLKATPHSSADQTILRRLTRSEWTDIKESGQVHCRDAACIIVVPPVNRDPTTKERIRPALGELPTKERTEAIIRNPKELAQILVVPSSLPQNIESMDASFTSVLPQTKIPLYHGAALFPIPGHRAAVHSALCDILRIEYDARRKAGLHKHENDRAVTKSSHAFLLTSNAKSTLRADSVPLAIALWRLWMWEGGGWDQEA